MKAFLRTVEPRYPMINPARKKNANSPFKETVRVILCDLTCKEGNVQFTKVP